MASNYITKLSERVEREHVRYNNRFGLAIAADIYKAKDLDIDEKHPAIIVGAPYGGVKEQGPCVYANELAKRGFVVLAFDQSFMGESSGEPRNISSPEIFTENFSAAVDFLGVKVPYVDCDKIGAIGICGSGGFALSAAQADTRIKAIATCSMYVMTTAARGMLDKDTLTKEKERLSLKRWDDFKNGYPEYNPMFKEEPLDEVPAGIPEPVAEWFRFYAVKRGHHPNARGGFTDTSNLSFLNTDLTAFIEEISPRPILFVMGDNAHSKVFSEMAYEKAQEPKEIYVVDDAEHIDLYDRVDRIPFDKLESFFNESLK